MRGGARARASRRRRWRHLFWVLPLTCAVPSAIRVSTYVTPVHRLEAPPSAPTALAGALHVHSTRSDGRGTPAEIAAAAKAAGLSFVVLTDHNIAPDAPTVMDGVTLLYGTEITTRDGHLLAMGFSGAPPPAGTPAHEAAARIHAQGGFTAVAHGHDPKAPWQRWDLRRVGGLEIYNAGSDARRSLRFPFARLLGAAFAYPFNGDFSFLLLHDRMVDDLRRFDELAARRAVVAYCGLDAHGIPSYERLFRAMRTYVHVSDPTRAPTAAELWAALRQGRHHCAVSLFGDGSRFRFQATQGARPSLMGSVLPAAAPVTFEVDVGVDAPLAEIVLYRNGAEVARARGRRMEHTASEPGAYRAEVQLPVPGFWGFDEARTWIYGNAIFVRRAAGVTGTTGASTH